METRADQKGELTVVQEVVIVIIPLSQKKSTGMTTLENQIQIVMFHQGQNDQYPHLSRNKPTDIYIKSDKLGSGKCNPKIKLYLCMYTSYWSQLIVINISSNTQIQVSNEPMPRDNMYADLSYHTYQS